jgi:hypothetical protein
MIAAAAAVTAALAAGTGAAVASTTDAKPGAHAKTMSATGRAASPRPADERQAQNAMTAAVAQTLHVSTARVSAALRPLFAAGHAETSSPAFAAAAGSLGVSTHQLEAALIHAKESVAASMHIKQGSRGSRTVGAKSAGANPAAERQAQNAMTAAAARALHVSTARVSAALRQLFAAGHADTSSPAFAAAARSLGVSTHQLAAALMHAKESLATGN